MAFIVSKSKDLNTHNYIANYRPDIDGLRAVAVSLVVLFHFWPKALNGGFIGVDVFFVISGYLITGIISQQSRSGNFSFLSFYTRRMKRILPVFYTVIIFSSFVAYFTLLPDAYLLYVKSALFASIYSSNFYFINAVDYFNNNAQNFPLLHTWSLAVEEQYYVFWPIILIVLSRFYYNRSKYIYVLFIAFLFSTSLAYAVYAANHQASFAYYAIFSRAYELMLGSVLALIVRLDFAAINAINRRKRIILANSLSIVGFAMIILAAVYYNEKISFPSYLALLPTLGAVFIIYAGHLSHQAIINKLLSFRYVVRIGLLSYSIYLWHWPVISYWHYLTPETPLSLGTGTILLCLTLFLAILSYFLIEQPLRHLKINFSHTLFYFQILPLCIIVTMFLIVIHNQGFPQRLKSEQAKLETLYLEPEVAPCFGGPITNYESSNCIFGAKTNKAPQVLLIGDSHAAHFYGFWQQIALKWGFNFKMLTSGACYPLINTHDLKPENNTKMTSSCIDQMKWLAKNYHQFRLIIVGASYFSYLSGRQGLSTTDYLKQQHWTFQFLSEKKIKLIIMGDVPQETSRYMNIKPNRDIIVQYLPWLKITHPKMEFLGEEYNLQIESQARGLTDIYYLSMHDLVTSKIKFYPYIDDFLLYKDVGHLNQHGSELLGNFYLHESQALILKKQLKRWNIIKNN